MALRIWVVCVGEPLPTDKNEPRLLRAGIVAGMLADAGHDVTWWTSNIDHTHKLRRFPQETEQRLRPGLRMILLDGSLYRSNVSLGRIRNHRQVAAAFAARCEREPPPDVIWCSFPTIELTAEVVAFGKRRGIPVAVDVRDLWPDVLVDLAPQPLRGVANLLLVSMRRQTRQAMRDAAAITALTQSYHEWGLAHAGRTAGPFDRVFPMAYVAAPPAPAAQRSADEFWQAQGIDPTQFVVAFFGTIGRLCELGPVIEAARLAKERRLPIQFALCGTGDSFEHYRAMAHGLDNIVLPGWVNAAQIWSLMRKAKVGIAPYVDSENFRKNVSNKIIEYMSAGLPVVTNLTGAVEELLKSNDAGYFYPHGSGQGLADVLAQAVADPATLARRSENTRLAFERSFSAERVYTSLIAYLEDLAARNGRSEVSRK